MGVPLLMEPDFKDYSCQVFLAFLSNHTCLTPKLLGKGETTPLMDLIKSYITSLVNGQEIAFGDKNHL